MNQIKKVSLAYMRVSTDRQELDRQLTAIKEYCPYIDPVNIFEDKETGKNFDREGLNALKTIISQYRKNFDKNELIIEVIIKELDRLGRNYQGIMEELAWLDKHGVMVRILEIPLTLVEVDKETSWIMEMTLKIIIEVYARLAQQEVEKKHRLIMEGIEEARKRGVKLGRPAVDVDIETFKDIAGKAVSGLISHTEAMKQLDLKRGTYYKNINQYFPNYEKKLMRRDA